ncbi:MAG TPA: PEP-CTERM sorting domain-containing protein [Dongiaceae bacterium]|nr:PEP-CTERM sorting domain-containing protein [Dongiaceae bacterium]
MTILRTVVPVPYLFSLLLLLLPFPASAAVITFSFLELVENQGTIDGRLANGSDWSGPAQAGGYEFFSWQQQDLTVTAHAEYWPNDDYDDPSGMQPSYVYLQPDHAGLGACPATNCSSAKLGYLDRLILDFSQQVELIGIHFSLGEDDSHISPDDDDYRAYNTRISMTGGPDGPESDLMGSGKFWNGSVNGNQLALYRPEGTGSYVQSITVRTVDVPEPGSLSLLALAAALGWWGRRRIAH